MVGRGAWPLFVALAMLAFTPRAAASEEEAAEVEAKARKAFSEGRYEEAARRFAEAHRIEPAAITKYNEGFSWEKAGRYAPQADAYEAARKLGTLDADREAHARERITILERSLGVLVIQAPERAKVTVAHADARLVPARIHLVPGRYEVVAVTPAGREHRREVEVEKADTTFLSFPPDPEAPRPPSFGEVDPVIAERRQIHFIAGGSMIAVGAVGGAMSVVFGAQFLDAVGDFEDSGQSDPDLRDRAIDMRLGANIALALGAAFAGAGVAVVLTAPSDPGRESDGGDDAANALEAGAPRGSWSLGLSGQGLWLRGTW